ncbi:futalosine hydrolase [Mucilaginibacter pallidiroseus]|uniref:Futalosine hydrolase n=1 Tax=Mucilaginibacter pallidiroseus TaxID=2599295 RepID=A0A563UGZ6_9SPHI|nr:futalosine hydrolase [Mucilaginibacter pallidiroseus]TWR30576.1 futalosine hydrolase [Mucilaginibacter pallidiroseus]
MRVLFVAATEFEIQNLKVKIQNIEDSQDLRVKNQGLESSQQSPITDNKSLITNHYSLLVTGVGMVATAYALGRELAINKYDLAINLGIAGSFDRSIALGDVVEITQDTLAELGAEDEETFIPINQMGFGEGEFVATAKLSDFYKDIELKQASAITVNTVHGNEASIQKLQQRLAVQIESMEGAAFFYVCREAGVPCLQIRAVSNYVEKRNRDAWQIGSAIKNLNTFAMELLNF